MRHSWSSAIERAFHLSETLGVRYRVYSVRTSDGSAWRWFIHPTVDRPKGRE